MVSPPTFHEIRSLAGRLYEKEKGKEFARNLLGHKSEKMTDKYLDARGKEYAMLSKTEYRISCNFRVFSFLLKIYLVNQ